MFTLLFLLQQRATIYKISAALTKMRWQYAARAITITTT